VEVWQVKKRSPLRLVKKRRSPSKPPEPPKQDLAPVDAAKRRDLLVSLLSERKSGEDIRKELNLTAVEFNRLLRETPGLQEEVNALMQAASIGERGANLGTRIEIRDDREADPFARLKAVDGIEGTAGIIQKRVDGMPTIVIAGETVNVGVAAPAELEEMLRTAAKRVGDPTLMKHVEAKIAGRDSETTEGGR
jgi:hypothetical protein